MVVAGSRLRGRRVPVLATVVAVVVGVMSPQAFAAPPKPAAPKMPAQHPDWRPVPRTPAPIAVQSGPVRPQIPIGAMPPAHRVRELAGKRTAHARFYELSDGRVQAAVATGVVNYRDRQGHFQPIDTTLGPVSRPGFAYGNDRNVFGSYFGTDPAGLVQLDLAGHLLTVGAPGALTAKPAVRANAVRYPGALRGADLDYQVTATGLKERIVLAGTPQDQAYTFTVELGGLSARQRTDGSVALFGEGADPVAVIPKPFMYDSAPDRDSPYGFAWSPKVTQTVTAGGGRLTIVVNADPAWLADPHRKYPVTIDPTIKIAPTVSQSQDAMIISDSPTTNFDGNWRLSVGTTDVAAARSLVKFDLSTIPAGTQIDSAQLRMYYDQTFTTDSFGVPVEAHRMTQPWDETTVTWSSANAGLGELGANQVVVDNSDTSRVAATGSWPSSQNSGAVGGSYQYNRDSVVGDTFTWTPRLTESDTYQVEADYIASISNTTSARYTVSYNGSPVSVNVDQTRGTGQVWRFLGSFPFIAGTTGNVQVGDSTNPKLATVADAVRFTKSAIAVKDINKSNVWHAFSVRNIVQSWLDGAQPNYGFMLKTTDESQLSRGGPRYEAAEYAYNGEDENTPQLLVTYGRPGVTLDPPTTIASTGAGLHWSAYADPDPANPNDDIVEYQVHRSVFQTFTPNPSTLVAPVPAGTTSFNDTTATPTPVDSPDPFGQVYYYMVAVKTRDGQLTAAPTQIVRLPRAGRVTRIIQGSGVPDTTLSSALPTSNEDVLAGSPWTMVGDNSSTFGKTRVLVKFPDLSGIPAGAQVQDATMHLWGFTMVGGGTATYEAHALTRDFDETTATWNRANATTSWTSAGGDYDSTVLDTVGSISNDPAWAEWTVNGAVQGWLNSAGTNHGFLIKLASETSPAERTIFVSSEAAEQQLRPKLTVTYTVKDAASTYYAPDTPTVLPANSTSTDQVTLTNTTGRTLTAADYVLSYHWALPDGSDATAGAALDTPLPAGLAPGASVTLAANVRTPIPAQATNGRTDYALRWELRNKTTNTWLSTSDGIGSLDQHVAIVQPTSDQLGLEKFYQYSAVPTGAGGTALVNLHAGNTVWSYNALANPSRGLATFTRLTYNSLDTSASSIGYGWSLATSTLTRLNTPLDLHPPGQDYPTDVTLTDGDGTSHRFTLNKHGSTDPSVWDYDHPHGVHLLLQKNLGGDTSRAWVMTSPDRTRFYFDDEGYQTAIADKNGNTLQLTYAERKSNNAPRKFLQYITDPANRQTLTLTYYAKGDDYTYIDDSGNEVQATGLTNPKIIDTVRTITDISGRQLAFTYTDKGLLAKLVDGAGNPAAKTFRFGYDMTNTNKNTKLVSVTDPRGHSTALRYYDAPTDPQFKWAVQTITDRDGGTTNFAYTDPDGPQGGQINTQVTDAENHASAYVMDGFGRPTSMTNAKQQATTLGWDGDNNVIRLQEDNGAVSTWTYDPNTGYPLTATDAEATAHGWPATRFTYATGLTGHIADLATKSSPEGRTWTFGYDPAGDLTSVTDPAGSATPTAGDFTTTYTYDQAGQPRTATDANSHTTTFGDYDPTGYPRTITDALNNASSTVYDARGNVTSITDALGHTSAYGYDVFGRPLDSRTPKDQAAGVFITSPAPVYDANDNVTQATAPNGAVTTAGYDSLDRVTAVHGPKSLPTDPDRTTSYAYDRVGNLTSSTAPKGNLTPADPNDFVIRSSFDEIYQLTDTVDAGGNRASYAYDDVGNVTTVIDPRKNATPDTTDFTAKYSYDLDHRVTGTTDAAGNTASQAYDRDGKVVSATDQAGNTTLITLDARGLTTQVDTPHAVAGGSIGYDSTQYAYDQAGNRTKVTSPRGVATPADPTDFATVTGYDQLNRPVEQDLPYSAADPRYNTPDKVFSTYDALGRLTRVSAPPSQGQTVRNDTTYAYFDNGWARSSSDPWDITTTYDYNELGEQTSRVVTSAGGSSSRTLGWSYNPDGTLRSRADTGVPVGKQVVLVDNSDTQNVKATGTWPAATSGTGFYGFDYRTHAAGTGTNTFAWTLNVPQGGSYEVFVRYPAAAATNAPYRIDYSGGTVTKPVDQTARAGQWVSLGTFPFAEGNTGKITLSDNANGAVAADAVKLVRDNSGDTQPGPNAYTNSYDPNGNLVTIADSSPGAAIDSYAIGYDGLDRVQQIQEKLSGTVKHTTGYTYDEIGDPLTRTHDAQVDSFAYDVRNLLATVTNKTSADDPSPKVTRYTYTVAGTTATQTKDNGNTVSYDYNLDWSLAHQVEKKPDGSVVAEHTLSYDPNGNKTRDASSVRNADDHSQLLNRVTVDTYDPRDRTAALTETNADTGASVSAESYVHDANSNVVSQTVNGTTTTFGYDRNRLQTSTAAGVTAGYNYDPFGRLDTVTAADGTQFERYVYDGFDRTVKHTKVGSGTSAYSYDPFDRTTSETTDVGGTNEKRTDYAYLGLTNQLLTESVGGTVTKTYQYSITGQRLSQTTRNSDGTTENADYGYSPHADVETLTDSGGNTKATYGYTAYGSNQTQDFTGIDKPDPADPTKQPYNVYRYDAKRFDPATGTIDMGFRDYAPGLNQFLTRDAYNGALADLNLTTSPWTGNRYAFAGGNPTTLVELNGHEPGSWCGTSSCYRRLLQRGMNPNGPDSMSSCTTACAPTGGYGSENGGPGSPPPIDPGSPLAFSTPEAYANYMTEQKLHCTAIGPVQTCPFLGSYYENGETHYTMEYFAAQAQHWKDVWSASDPEGYAKFVDWADKTNRYGCHDVTCWAIAAGETAVGLLSLRLGGEDVAGVPRFEGPLAGEAFARVASGLQVIKFQGLKLPGVPKGAIGTPVKNGEGLIFQIPAGTPELHSNVTAIRIMAPTTGGYHPYPNGRAMYMNAAGQTVNPFTGEMIHDMSDPYAHIEPLFP